MDWERGIGCVQRVEAAWLTSYPASGHEVFSYEVTSCEFNCRCSVDWEIMVCNGRMASIISILPPPHTRV